MAMRLTEKDIVKQLFESAEQYKPLVFLGLGEEPDLAKGIKGDAVMKITLQNGPSFKVLLEIVPVATPKIISEKSRLMLDKPKGMNRANLIPVIIAPYIATKQAVMLAEQGISWIDLSGNIVLQVPGQVYFERTGKKNKFPDTAPIKKIFQGTSSLVARALLLKPDGFRSLYETVNFINKRNASITVSTVSRVLKSLEEDLLVEKSGALIVAIDREMILDRLTKANITSGKRKEVRTYRYAVDNTNKFFHTLFEIPIEYVACRFYAAKLKGLAVTDEIAIFVKDMGQITKAVKCNQIDLVPDAEFGNLSITEARDPGVWFNVPLVPYNNVVVDDIELYIEMMAEGPRGPKIAKLLKQRILKADTDG